jgi:hypothetical protein
MLSTLEVLQEVKDNLLHKNFVFSEWTDCTCGHIYRGIHGRKSRCSGTAFWMFEADHEPYKSTIVTVAKALGWSGRRDLCLTEGQAASQYVSRATEGFAVSGPVHREHAIAVINKAIANIEAAEVAAAHEFTAAA